MTNWDEKDVKPFFARRFAAVEAEVQTRSEERLLDKATLTGWIEKSYQRELEKLSLSSDTLLDRVLKELENRTVQWKHTLVFVKATNGSLKGKKGDGDQSWSEILAKTR